MDHPPETLASIDLGSNSFHLLVARLEGGHLHKVDGLRQPVRLAAGLDTDNNLTPAAEQRALECLEVFGQRLQDLPPERVRAVGTNTLRRARNGRAFLRKAQQALGHTIQIIGGVEEARLVYLGVAHSVAAGGGRRLVVDIGGGSTELILGEQFEPQELESLHMGCVSSSQRFFPKGVIRREAVQRAETAALLELRPMANRYCRLGWDMALGSSGTIKAVGNVVREMGSSEFHITFDSLKKLRKVMLEAGHVNRLKLKGLNDDRRPVFAGGVMVLYSVFKALRVEEMVASPWALREGLLFDLRGRTEHEDVRGGTVDNLCRRYRVDREHGGRVSGTSLRLWQATRKTWGLTEDDRDYLVWAARLHELGLAVSHSGYHKHGEYLLANSDLAGFSRYEQKLLSVLVRLHRRKLSETVLTDLFEEDRGRVLEQVVLLRLAVLLHRGHNETPLPDMDVEAKGNTISLSFPKGWLFAAPLTSADLEQEHDYLRAAGIKLRFS